METKEIFSVISGLTGITMFSLGGWNCVRLLSANLTGWHRQALSYGMLLLSGEVLCSLASSLAK